MRFTVLALLHALVLTGCVSASFEGSVEPNRVVTDVLSDGATIAGRYDPSGFTAAHARNMAGASCNGGDVATYTEEMRDGQVVFFATCTNGTVHGAGSGINFTRTTPGSVTYSSIYSSNGQIVTTEGTLAM